MIFMRWEFRTWCILYHSIWLRKVFGSLLVEETFRRESQLRCWRQDSLFLAMLSKLLNGEVFELFLASIVNDVKKIIVANFCLTFEWEWKREQKSVNPCEVLQNYYKFWILVKNVRNSKQFFRCFGVFTPSYTTWPPKRAHFSTTFVL